MMDCRFRLAATTRNSSKKYAKFRRLYIAPYDNSHFYRYRISFSLTSRLELQLEDWRSLRPKPTSRSRAIRVLLRRALAAEEEREDGSSDQKTEAQSSGA
jgi:hypothetical protein